MPSYRPYHYGKKKWVARRKRHGVEYFIDYFETEEEAALAEEMFDNAYPPRSDYYPKEHDDRAI